MNIKYISVVFLPFLLFWTATGQNIPTSETTTKTLQNFVIESLDSLSAHIIRQHNEETRQDIDNYQNLKDYKWLHLLPTVGYDTRWSTVTVAISTTQFVNYYQHRDTKKYNVIQLEHQAERNLQKDLFILKGYYTKLIKQLQELETRHDILLLNRQLYQIDSAKYANTEIRTEEFLSAEKSQLQQLQEYQSFKIGIYQTIAEIEKIIKKPLVWRAALLSDDFKNP